ncbi:phage head-tail connector protein [Streptosporangium sp. NBC_01495]|uniref:phage head-tail connector protein n=1 Tax=Streptosporangium sp. NBC_01495 TaxID=2903899 RepID=UPI002E376ECE|nr:phage head-tail connector protein [Streptosporangium sp. NBC_01495]
MAYIELATLKNALGVTDTDRDALLEQAISAATSGIDERCGRTFGRDIAASTRTFRTRGRTIRDDHGGELLLVDDIATDEGLVIEVGDRAIWTPVHETRFETEPENALVLGRPVTSLALLYSWWSLYRRARITAVWGWPEVPAGIKQAALLQASRLYRRKDSPEGVAGSAEWGLVRMPNLDPDVRALVEPFRLTGFG